MCLYKNSHWFLGQVLNQVNAKTPMEMWVKWSQEHPDAPLIRYMSFANTEMVLVNSLEAHRQVLQVQNNFIERPNAVRRMIGRFGGDGLTSFEFEDYRAHRKMLGGCFTPDCLRRLEPVFKEKAVQLTDFLDRAIAACGGESAVIDCTDACSRYALDIIGRAVLGVEFSCLDDTVFDQYANPVPGTQPYGFLDAHDAIFGPDRMGKIFSFLDAMYPIRWLPCRTNTKFLKATGWTRKQEFGNPEKTAEEANCDDTSRDILSFLLEESRPGGYAEGIKDANIVGHVSHRSLYHPVVLDKLFLQTKQLLILMAGGHETTAHTLAWCTHTLATRPDIQDRLRGDLLGLATKDPSFSDIDALPYLNNFVHEVLRVYPPAVWTPRQAYRDLQICGTHIPKDTLFEIVPSVVHMNPLIWGEDAAEINPSRWDSIGTGAKYDPRTSPFAFEAFTNGPKTCIGKKAALREIKIALFEMVRRYRFLAVDREDGVEPFTVETPGIVLRPKGMKVRVERIEGK
ncbi:hypothetical protein KVR01_012015 [Diaporthe batatas]|uniref:uncharacterized protein n=1 Tax=Diaporthe batatas TaxID=748121 RepID=UPI001D054301|nr:uncharacterized protein KVR01_012015 [Diaporthe batatas]KAG8158254.1 hypothetical protein KVR01_012015 [Diaporthe batatas]